MFITVYTEARHWSLSSATYTQSAPSYRISQISIPTLYSNVSLRLFSCGCATKIFYSFLIFPVRATCLAHLIVLDFITLIIFVESYKENIV